MMYAESGNLMEKGLKTQSLLRRILNWTGPFPNWLTGAWLPTIVYLCSYGATTAIGATIFLTSDGQHELKSFLGTLDPGVAASVGSPVYIGLLYLPFLIVPAFALVGMRGIQQIARRQPFGGRLPEPRLSRSALWVLMLFAGAYCLYRLDATNALLSDLLLDPTATYRERILERARLFENLGPLFFILCYGVIPILASIFLVNFEKCGRKIYDIIGFLLIMSLFYFLIFHIYSKSHILVVSIMLISAVVISRSSFLYIPFLGAMSFAIFISMELLLSGVSQTPPKNTPEVEQADTQNSAESTEYLKYFVAKAMLFRMASSFPFYVSIFHDPSMRCGIEAHTVRLVLRLPPSKCTLPTKVFPVMYPKVHWVTGYAPAPAHVSAYGERGFLWSLIVMALSGLSLGILGALSMLRSGPLFVALGVAACTFAYYLSQLPIVAAFTYGHGLIFLTLPIVLLYGVSLVTDKLSSRSRSVAN